MHAGLFLLLMPPQLAPTLVKPPRPAVVDLMRMPPAEVVKQAVKFNEQAKAWAVSQQEFEWSRRDDWREIIEAIDWCGHCWSSLQSAQAMEERPAEHLEDLQRLIGVEAYLAGWMPPAVPVGQWEILR